MSKIPYVRQEDSPNLVIVPTVTCYEPSPKKTKLESTSSSIKVPETVQASEKSALIKNVGAKVKPRVSSVNKNVLIDVSQVKRQPNSWATNFLQSIGGSASKVPRAYNWHSSASKLAFQRNGNIEPVNYLPNTHLEMNTNTTQSNANKETIQIKSMKKLVPIKTHTNASKPKTSNDFSLSNGTNVTTKSKTQCSAPKLNTEAHQSIESKARFLPTVSKDSSYLKANKEATLKTKKEASQPKPTKGVIHQKPNKNELTHKISDTKKKDTQTKAVLKKECHEEATKLRGKSETCRTKVNDKSSDQNVDKGKSKTKILKVITEKKPSKTQTSVATRENIALKKIKVDGKKTKELGSDKNKKSEGVKSIKIKRESSKPKKSTSPIKSVVKKIKYHNSGDKKHSDEYELNHNSLNLEKMSKDSDVDLRAKLKRRVSKNDNYNKEYESTEKRKCNKIFPSMSNGKGFVPDENLIISFDTENDKVEVDEKMKPVKTKTRKHQSSGNKCKKIKLEINIVFQKDDSSDDESPNCGIKEDNENNNDLSFLDDFNVDEIAESLNDCQSNIVKTDNLTNFNECMRTSKIDIDLPVTNDETPAIDNSESISKGEIVIENNTTNVSSLTLCNEKSTIQTENKSIELLIKVQSLTDHNGVTKQNHDKSELKSNNMLEPQREAGSVKGKTDKLSNANGEVKTEFVVNDSILNKQIICAECSKDLRASTNNMEKLSESATLPGERKSKTDKILTCTEIKSEEVHNSTPSMQLETNNTNKLEKEDTRSVKTTNIDSDKKVENLAADQNISLPSDMNNISKTMSDKNPTTTVHSIEVETIEASIFVDNIKHENEVILIEDSDNDCDDNNTAKVQDAQSKNLENLVEHNIIDFTSQKGCSLETNSKEVFTADPVKPKTNETDSEPILILDTDYDELKTNDDLKNKKGVMESKKLPEPIDIIKKHLFCNYDKTYASDKILEKPDKGTVFNHKTNSETKNNQCKSKQTVTLMTSTRKNKSDDVKIKKSTANNITPSVEDKKDATTNKVADTHKITPVAKDCTKDGQDQAQTKTQSQKILNSDKKIATAGERLPFVKEKHDDNIKTCVVNKCDTTTHNTVAQNQPKTNTQDHKDAILNFEKKSSIADKQLLSNTNDNNDIDITMWLENKISQDMKGNLDDEEKSASTKNENSTAKENHDGKIRMWVVNKGDTRTNPVEQNQPKTNPEDTIGGKPITMDNMNTQNVNAKCQPNESNKTSTQAASVENKNAPAKEKQDNKTTMAVKGDPRNKQNQRKPNSPETKDGKPKTVTNINSQNVNAKCQPKVPNKYNPKAKDKNLASGLAQENLVELDLFARRLEYRMRQYFGAKYWVTELIHSGAFSTIYHCKDGTGASKTVKQIKDSWQIGAHKEGMMMKLQKGVPENNYNCVRFGHGFSLEGHWCYVMEYFPKNLQEAMNINNRSFHIDKVQEFSRQLVAAVTILRNNNIIHSDISPMHILINDSETRIKLCGFDQAFYYSGGDLLPNVGTPNYRAPELILGFHADYGIDVWATALVIYEMATNRQLFPGYYNNDILYKQFCTLAAFPYEMLERCYYRSQHFMGDSFVRIVGSRGEGKLLVRDFPKKERIHSGLFQVYLAEWAKFGANRDQEKSKLNALGKLLNKMLVMDPRNRIAIEFVFADPFIFERF